MPKLPWREKLKQKSTDRVPVNTTLPRELVEQIQSIVEKENLRKNAVLEAVLSYVLEYEKNKK